MRRVSAQIHIPAQTKQVMIDIPDEVGVGSELDFIDRHYFAMDAYLISPEFGDRPELDGIDWRPLYVSTDSRKGRPK